MMELLKIVNGTLKWTAGDSIQGLPHRIVLEETSE